MESPEPIRVLIVDMPGMLREIVREAVVSDEGMVVAGEVPGDAGIAEATTRARADVVILEANHPMLAGPGPARLGASTDAVRLLAVGADGRESFLYALKPTPIALGDLSRERLLAAIRSDGPVAGNRPTEEEQWQ